MLASVRLVRRILYIVLLPSLSGFWWAAPADADDVFAGIDLLTTVPGGATAPLNLPAGFFDPGSNPVSATVTLDGKPLDQLSGDPIGTTDTIVSRLADASALTCGNPAVIPIELVALRLHGKLEVTYSDGSREIWDLDVCRSNASPSTGFMTIQHTCGEGGLFTSTLTVVPRVIFTRVSDGMQRFLDPATSVDLTAGGSWVHDPLGLAATVGPGIRVDGDCNAVADAVLPGTSNFFPGLAAGPCDTCFSAPAGTSPPNQVPTPPLVKQRLGHIANDHLHDVELTPPPPRVPPPCTVDDDFEGGATGWFNDAASTCASGAFVLGTPTEVINGGVTTQVGGNHTEGGEAAFFTATNTSAGVDDVDGGVCILASPTWSVEDASTLSIWYYFGQRDAGDDPGGDFFSLDLSTDGGASFTSIVSVGDVVSQAVWTNAEAAIPAGSTVQLRVHVADGAAVGDLIEGGIDDVSICPQ